MYQALYLILYLYSPKDCVGWNSSIIDLYIVPSFGRDKGYLSFKCTCTQGKWKFWMENQMICAFPFKKLQNIWAEI